MTAIAMDTSVGSRAGKYLTFVLDTEQYGVPIIKVREILVVLPITPMPQTPHFIKGVINLRGKVIPVVDTRLKFGMMEKEYTSETCIIVVEVKEKGIGLVVDTVREVRDVAEDQIEDPPNYGGDSNAFIRGLGKVNEKVIILLDIDQVLGDLDSQSMGGFSF